MRSLRVVPAVLVVVLGAAAFAATFQPPPSPARWVTDTAFVITPQTRVRLDDRLERYQRATGRQVVVWIGQSTGEVPLEEWAVRTFEAWGVGRKGGDDGVAVFLFAQDRKLRIEVGYGLEGDLPDLVAHRIIQEQAVPLLKAGDPDGAVDATVSALLQRLGGEVSPPPARATRPNAGLAGTVGAMSLSQKLFWGVVMIALLILFITNPRLAFLLLWSLASGGSRRSSGWGGGGGGGFGGGGGRSGGGGASGSW